MYGDLEYYRPETLEAAMELAARWADRGALLAGGTDLVVEMKRGQKNPAAIIDISRIAELHVFDANGSRLRLGAALPFAEFEDADAVLRYAPALAQAASEVGSPQIRSTATIGGNIVTASAAGDSLPALVAHDAILVLESARGRRELSVAGFLENRPASLGSGEIVTEICVPKKDKILMAAFAKLGRRNALAIARISAALVVTLNREGRTEARLVLGAVAAAPLRVPEAERLIEAEGPVRDQWLAIAEAASAAVVRSILDRPSAPYKTQAAKGLVLDLLEKAGCS